MLNKKLVFLIITTSLLKLTNLQLTPMFGDEATYCASAYQIREQGWQSSWNSIIQEKNFGPLLSLTQGLLLTHWSGSTIFACRAVSVISSVITNIFVLAIISLFSSDFTVQSAAILFSLLNPFNFFYDRTSLQEPLLNMFITALAFWFWRGKHLAYIIIAYILAFLTKLTALMITPGIILSRWKYKFTYSLSLIITIFLVFIWARNFTHLTNIFGYHAYAITRLTILSKVKTNLWLTLNWYQQYLGSLFFIVLITGIWQFWHQKKLFILIPVLFILGSYILLADNYFPRLLLITLPFISIAIGFAAKNKFGFLGLVLILFTFINTDLKILFKPDQAKIAPEDHFQFFLDWTSGSGPKSAVNILSTLNPKVVIIPKDLEATFKLYSLDNHQPPSYSLLLINDIAHINQLMEQSNFSGAMLVSTSHHGWLQTSLSGSYKLDLTFQTYGEESRSVWGYKLLEKYE